MTLEERGDAVDEMNQLVKNGDKHAQYLMGKLWRDGPLLTPGWVNARYWFQKSAEQGHTYAQYALGKLLLSDDPEAHDVEDGIRWLRRAAESGNQYAQYMLGKLYLMGQGVEYDKKLGMYWLSQSAAQGNVYAKALLQRQDSGRPPHVFLAVTRLFHHMSRIFQERFLPQSGTGPQVDSKLRQRIKENKIAMGHRPDNHEEGQNQGGMVMGGMRVASLKNHGAINNMNVFGILQDRQMINL